MFWGGGSVALATSADDFHVLKCRPSERLEDGTVNFLDIASLRHGFALMQRLGGIHAIQVRRARGGACHVAHACSGAAGEVACCAEPPARARTVARAAFPPQLRPLPFLDPANRTKQAHVEAMRAWTHDSLITLRHSNGQPMVALFGKHHMPDAGKVQGGIFNFGVMKPDGSREFVSRREPRGAARGPALGVWHSSHRRLVRALRPARARVLARGAAPVPARTGARPDPLSPHLSPAPSVLVQGL